MELDATTLSILKYQCHCDDIEDTAMDETLRLCFGAAVGIFEGYTEVSCESLLDGSGKLPADVLSVLLSLAQAKFENSTAADTQLRMMDPLTTVTLMKYQKLSNRAACDETV